jgi:pimeloyl-ACP methyl ester carboxylesterase
VTLVPLPDGRRLQIWRGGVPGGPAVLFLPGCPDSRLVARSGEAAARRAGVELIGVNRPGYGRSTPAASGHLSVAADLVAAADLLGLSRFALAAMSLGGPYALAAAARHPDRVSAVAAVASPSPEPAFWRPGQSDLRPLSVDEAVAVLRPEFESFAARMNPEDPDDDALAARWVDGLPPLDLTAMKALPVADLAAAAREALGRPDGYLRDAAATFRPWEFRPEDVRSPVRLWYGKHDTATQLGNGEWLAGHIPGAGITVDPGTAHLSTLLAHWGQILPWLASHTSL